MSTELARRQADLVAALWSPSRADAVALAATHAATSEGPGRALWERGLAAYRSNGLALAQRALVAAYPVVAELLGTDSFAALAHHAWRRQPPERGDLAQWGGGLAQWIEALSQLAGEEPYLGDVARIEWALHEAALAGDRAADLSSLALLAQQDPTDLVLQLAPGTWCAASGYPAASIVLAHLEGVPTLEEAGARLRAGQTEAALVWRQGLKPCLRAALPGEQALLRALGDSHSLGDALQSAPVLDFQAWLPLAVQTGLLLGARLRSN